MSRTEPPVQRAPRDGWCFIGFQPAPRWHHHMTCMAAPPGTDDLAGLVRRLRVREDWKDAFVHRTYLMFAHYAANEAGDPILAEELLALDSQLFRVIERDGGGRPGVHYFDEPAPEVLPHDRRRLWPTYECTVLAVTEWHQVELGRLAFRFDGPDPQWTFLHRWKEAPRFSRPDPNEIATDIYRNARSWIEDRGGWVEEAWDRGPLAPGVKSLLDSSPGGLVFGKTNWGDILLHREVAYAFAESARLVRHPITRADLEYRLPGAARHRLHLPDEDEFDIDEEDEEPVDDQPERWDWYFADGAWPWLVATEHQAHHPSIPEDAETRGIPTTLDGDGHVWADAYSVITALSATGVPVERDDQLVDRAMGPLGISGTWNAQDHSGWECTCRRSSTWSCQCHPLPTRRGDLCDACGTYQVVRIGYGYPTFERGWPGDWVVGGCVPRPEVAACRACGTLFDREGRWLRGSVWEEPRPVAQTPVPPLERGLTALYLAAVEAFAAPLALDPEALDWTIPVGLISGGWWQWVPGLAAGCTCRGESSQSGHLSIYRLAQDQSWLESGSEWNTETVGVLHVSSLDEPVGSILVRRSDGEVVAVEGPDGNGEVLARATNRFDLVPTQRVRAVRPVS